MTRIGIGEILKVRNNTKGIDMTKRPIHAHGHNTRTFTPKETTEDKTAAEARADSGTMCAKCKSWNLKHRKLCYKCKKRIKPSPLMTKQAIAAQAEADARVIAKQSTDGARKEIAHMGKKFVLVKRAKPIEVDLPSGPR